MSIIIRGNCSECGKTSNVENYNNKFFCIKCLKKINIDYQWLEDYKQALKDLDKELEL